MTNITAIENQENAPLNGVSDITAKSFTPPTNRVTKTGLNWRWWHALLIALLTLTISAMWFIFSARSVVVTTIPQAQQLSTHGAWHLNMAEHRLMLPGQYELHATLKDHFPIKQTFSVADEVNQLKDFRFVPLPGHLTIEFSGDVGSGFIISIDQQQVEHQHNTVRNIAAGKREILIEAPGYFPYSATLTIEGKQQTQLLKVSLKPDWATINISSVPLGVEVLNQQGILGITPLTVNLSEGQHQLTFKKANYQQTQRDIKVIAQHHFTLPNVTLIKQRSQLILNTRPHGVSVTLGEHFLGTTPLDIKISPGLSQNLLLFKPGHQSQRHALDIQAGQILEKQYILRPLTTEVSFRVTPHDATLHLDSVNKGNANQTLLLPVKEQLITFKRQGYVDKTISVLPNQSQQQLIQVTLKTHRQSRWENLKPHITAYSGTSLKLFKPNATFTMGASRREQGRRANETARKIKLDRAFYLGIREVTNGEFKQFKLKHSSGHIKGNSLNGAQQPAVSLSWLDAVLFCNWLSKKDGLKTVYEIADGRVTKFNLNANGYRLPTEAEWAWAARYESGSMKKYLWGNALPPTNGAGNFADVSGASILGEILSRYQDKYIATAPAGSFKPNHNGLFDIDGNVAEWIHDYYHIKTTLGNKPERNPAGPTKGNHHVIRGASWAHGSRTQLRLSYRDYGVTPRNDVGFRVARNAL